MMVHHTELEILSRTSLPSSTHGHNHNHDDIYDVFISFRGVDTRYTFTDHLYDALVCSGFNTFLDDEEIETGEPLKPELERGIKSSRLSIIVLSKNYASSTWCLEELTLILEQKRNRNQIVIPIFYEVEPTDVRKQQSSFGKGMRKHRQRMKAETSVEKKSEWAQKIELWKMALTQVANLKGKVAKNRKETEFIEEVVTDVHRRLGVCLGNAHPLLIGMEDYVNFISSWLKDGSCRTTDILTVVGIGGTGKTSLSKYVFRLHSAEFQQRIFIEDIDTKFNSRSNELLDLQKQLRKVILKKQLQDSDVSRKVFIVLDDIGSLDQLDALLGNKALHPGSKIIITTKDASLTKKCALFDLPVQPNHREVSLNGLYEPASLELLCIHAFNSHTPKEGYEDVSKELVKYCDGHPLALQVLGWSLKKQDVAYWKDCIKVLKKEPHSHINKVLKMSYDALLFENDKELFKHIACFFVGVDRDMTETILNACDINARLGIRNLTDRCLLSVKRNKLKMHPLIQEMGRDLVRQEYLQQPWKRSRLWCHEESLKVLKQKKDKGNLLGLALDTRMLVGKKLGVSLELEADSLSNMDSLMLLQLNYVHIYECFQTFPEELRWLCMHGFPLRSIHLGLPMENLVALDMSYSNIEYFDMSYSNPQPPVKWKKGLSGSSSKDRRLLGSLKILDLSFCKHLHSVGGFSQLPALEKLIVKTCTSLIEVCESVGQCTELVHIDMSYCYKLNKLPTSLGNLNKVQTLLLKGCNACEFIIEDMNSSHDNINSQKSSPTSPTAMPSDCKFIMTSLPSSLKILSLANNNLYNGSFPMDFSCLAMLEELCLSKNPIVSMPNCVGTLPKLHVLSMDCCYNLISIEHPPRTLKVLSIGYSHIYPPPRKIKFDLEMSPLRLRGIRIPSSYSSLEIDGMVKIQPMADVEEKVLHSLGWSNLEFIKNRRLETRNISRTKLHYEFGIFSTFYFGEGMPNWVSCRTEGSSISFIIPSSPNKLRGLNLCYVEWTSFLGNELFFLPTIKIRNITKNQTWVYHHCIRYAKDVWVGWLSFLSHWMFGQNEMKAGDHITIILEYKFPVNDQVIKECGIGLVYDEDGNIGVEEENVLGYYKSWNHIIGGDLSAFQLTTGEYILNNNQFTLDLDNEVEKGLFKAFSLKTSKILGSEARCSQRTPDVCQQIFLG
ncbi:disease resistance protein RUN1-like [Bidens hawaiensis]|uniref:disease resistance protein RUN1-like n=1 Tax=Bidens hawaiensis TaxID=980011 RepID=UPI00404976D6